MRKTSFLFYLFLTLLEIFVLWNCEDWFEDIFALFQNPLFVRLFHFVCTYLLWEVELKLELASNSVYF